MGLPSKLEAIEVVSRRIDFLDALRETPAYKPGLVETLDHSRSTVDRAVDELESEGFIERGEDGYAVTQSGQLAADRYRLFLEDVETILDAKAVIDAVPAACDLPPELCFDAHAAAVEGPYGVFARIAELMPAADRYRVVLPQIVDSRHVRIWHSGVVRQGLEVELFASASLLTRLDEEFPELTNELADAGSFTAHNVETPPYGLVLTTEQTPSGASGASDASETLLLLTYDADGVAGVVATSNPDAVAWATEQFEELRDVGRPATGTLRSNHASEELSTLTGARLPLALRSEGFRRLDGEFLEGSEAIAPGAGWRAGLGLPEVAAGYALERQTRDGSSLTEALLDPLEAGTDVALIGPAGSGKSTVCKQVACRWRDDHDGVVFYRESGAGGAFGSPSVLESVIERATVPVLVVVEDAVRLDTARIFEVMRAVAGREDVTFLLDARDDEWRDPDDSVLDARLDAFRHDAVEVVSVPPIDEQECRRLVDGAEAVLGTTLDVDPADLLAAVRSVDGDTTTPGTMLLLSHRIARLASPLAEYESPGQTTLDEDVDRVRRELAEVGETALDVGLLLNTLNAAGVELYPALAYAVATLDRADEQAQVEAALRRLEGHVVFEQPDATGYRGIHESWSERFLERLLKTESEYPAAQRFGRCLSVLFGLADEPEQCDSLARVVGGRAPVLDRIVTDPAEWADEVVRTVFEMGVTNARLAPLFGRTGESAITLPAACSADTELRCLELRGRMYRIAGEFERARAAFNQLDAVARERGEHTLTAEALCQLGEVAQKSGSYDRARGYYEDSLAIRREIGDRSGEAESLGGLGDVAIGYGEYDRAREYYEGSLEITQEIGDRSGEAESLNGLGIIAQNQGAYDRAHEYFEDSLAIKREIGDRSGEATSLMQLGNVADQRGAYDRAREYFEDSLAIRRETGDRSGEASSLMSLGHIPYRRGDYDQAREYYERSLEIFRELGNRRSEAVTLHNLGHIAERQGAYDRASDYFEDSLAIKREIGDRSGEAESLQNLGTVAQNQGAFDRAREYFEDSLAIRREIGDRSGEAESLNGLGAVATRRGGYDRAREYFEDSLAIRREIGDRRGEATVLTDTADVLRQQGEYERALEYAEEALGIAREIDHPRLEASGLLGIGAATRMRGESERARSALTRALDGFEEVGAPQDTLETLQHLVETCREQGDQEQAREWCQHAEGALAEVPEPIAARHEPWVADCRDALRIERG